MRDVTKRKTGLFIPYWTDNRFLDDLQSPEDEKIPVLIFNLIWMNFPKNLLFGQHHLSVHLKKGIDEYPIFKILCC
jgi:hypothetical protein